MTTAYPVYLDAGVDWLDTVPEGWSLQPLRNITSFTTGWTPPTGDAGSYDGEYLWANISDLGPKKLSNTAKRLSAQAIKSNRIPVSPEGSLLFSFKLTIGTVSIVDAEMYTNEAIATFRPSDRLLIAFAYYALPYCIVKNANENIYGAPMLNARLMRSARVVVPPFEEQRQIADYLDVHTAKIDALIGKQERLIETLAERRQAVITDEIAKITSARHVPLKYLYTPSKDANSPDLQVLSVYRDHGVIPKASRTDNFNKTPDDISRYLVVRPGDLVVNKMKAWQGSLGVASDTGVVSPDYEVLRLLSRHLESRFVHHLLRSPKYISEYGRRSVGIRPSQWRLYWDQLGAVRIPIPSMLVQHDVSNRIDRETAQMDALSAKAREMIDVLKERRQALISAAVTGKIDVRGLA